jgi:uncharacterized sulfatase
MIESKKFQHRLVCGTAGFAALCSTCVAAANAAQERPNVIIFFTDDHGWADLGIQSGRTDVKTPFTDQLARDGVRFSNGHSTAPQCVPSRAGLMTGRYQTRFDMETNLDGPLPLSEKTLASRMKAAGYVTGMVGKWHLDPSKESTKNPDGNQPLGAYSPRNRGFDEYWNGAMRTYEANIDLKGNLLSNAPQRIDDPRFRIDVQTEAALSFLKRRAKDEKPFFLYVAYFAPHVPLEKPEKYMARFKNVPDETRRMALAAISAIDDGVGSIREFLEQQGLSQNTVIFYMADNGAPRRPAAWDGSLNDPMVGEKGMLTDGGTRVPFLMTWPGHIPAGQVYDKPVITFDATATAMALSGQPVPSEMDGVNLIPFVTGEQTGSPHETLYWRWRSQAAILENGWKLWFVAPDRWFLFADTGTTPEKENVINQYPEVAQKLRAKLEDFVAQQTPPGFPKELHPGDKVFLDAYYDAAGNALTAQPAAATAAAPSPAKPVEAISDWTARNGVLEKTPAGLTVRGSQKTPPPFITADKLSIPTPVAVEIQLTAEAAGCGKVEWRTAGDQDFMPQSRVAIPFNQGKQTLSVPLPNPNGKKLIHLRIVLPFAEQNITIQSVLLRGSSGTPEKSWDF